jgi:uncharacterized protein
MELALDRSSADGSWDERSAAVRTAIAIAVAGSFGALARYGLEGWVSRRAGSFPWGTFAVNVSRCARRGSPGATVIRGIEGFGADSRLHTARILRLSEDLPVLIEIVDSAEQIERVLPVLDEMVGEGMVTVERVEVIAYRGSAQPPE